MKDSTAIAFAVAGGASLGLFAASMIRLAGAPQRSVAHLFLGAGALGSLLFDGQARAASLGILAAGSGQFATQMLEQAHRAAVKRKLTEAGKLATGWLSALGGGK